MTQRIFDIENEKDMRDLWEILPEGIERISSTTNAYNTLWSKSGIDYANIKSGIILINWHDKTEITRPIKEVTEEDVGKICKFWDNEQEEDTVFAYGQLLPLDMPKFKEFPYEARNGRSWRCARRLTKQEIEELC